MNEATWEWSARFIIVQSFVLSGSLCLRPPDVVHATDRRIRVMTFNLYVGADLTPVFIAVSLPELALRSSEAFQQAQPTDFPARAKVLAREIKNASPMLLGLQEVALWRRGETGIADGPVTPATIVVDDYLWLLLHELPVVDRPYVAVVIQVEGDNEVPTTLGHDVRLTVRDVILAQPGLSADDLRLTNPQSGTYATNLTVPTAAGPVTIVRGWTAVDALSNRRTFRFINTHLESLSSAHRTAQATELINTPANAVLPIVLVGDFNSPPSEPAPSANARLRSAGFKYAWITANGDAPGLTCCNGANLLNVLPTFDERIDLVLLRPSKRGAVEAARVVGVNPEHRTPSGLWPSDHAGVVAELSP
jgi:hypothetical protein